MTAALPFVDHTSDAYARDPHGYLAAAREQSPVARTPDGFGVLTHAACVTTPYPSGVRTTGDCSRAAARHLWGSRA